MSVEPSAAGDSRRRTVVDGSAVPTRTVAWVVVALAVIGAGCSGSTGDDDSGGTIDGADTDTDTVTDAPVQPSTSVTPPVVTDGAAGVQPEGFTTITARITEPDGEQCDVCLWLADTPQERSRGLMGVTDLGDAVGMAFVFDEPTTGAFYMFETPTPLSIAWFAPDGGFVGSADMAPCLGTPADECARYSPDEAYDLAIEAFDDGSDDPLVAAGLGPGSSVVLVAGTEATACPDSP